MKSKLLIYGIGKFAEYLAFLFSNDSKYEVIGYCIEENYLKSNKVKSIINNLHVYSFENVTNEITDDFDIFIAIGNNDIRARIFKKAIELKLSFANYISSKATIWENFDNARNIFIGEGSIIQPYVNIGDNTFIIGGRIGHHCNIGNHVLMTGNTIGGNATIGNFCYLGMNSTIKQNLAIAQNTVIGMGCNLEKNTNPYEVYSNKGTTKRKVDSKQLGNRFLK